MMYNIEGGTGRGRGIIKRKEREMERKVEDGRRERRERKFTHKETLGTRKHVSAFEDVHCIHIMFSDHRTFGGNGERSGH